MPQTSASTTRLPRAIRDQMARIEAMKGNVSGDSESQPKPDTTEEAVVETSSPAAQVSADEAPAEQNRPDLLPFNDPAANADPRFNDAAYWRQRVSVQQGFLRTERAAAETAQRKLKARIAELEAENLSLKSAAEPEAVDPRAYLSESQIEAIGPDQATAIATAAAKASRKSAAQMVADQRAADAARQAEENEEAGERARREFLDQLSEAEPTWQVVNASEDFRAWLTEIDPRTGQWRQASLEGFANLNDAKGVAGVFAAYRAAKAPRPAPTAATPPRNAGNGGSPAPAAAGDKSRIPPTMEEVRDYYKRCAVNNGRGVSDAERVEMEARIRLM